MPALGLYPWPKEDRPSRVAVMIAAHFVYGGVTSAVNDLFSNGEARSELAGGVRALSPSGRRLS